MSDFIGKSKTIRECIPVFLLPAGIAFYARLAEKAPVNLLGTVDIFLYIIFSAAVFFLILKISRKWMRLLFSFLFSFFVSFFYASSALYHRFFNVFLTGGFGEKIKLLPSSFGAAVNLLNVYDILFFGFFPFVLWLIAASRQPNIATRKIFRVFLSVAFFSTLLLPLSFRETSYRNSSLFFLPLKYKIHILYSEIVSLRKIGKIYADSGAIRNRSMFYKKSPNKNYPFRQVPIVPSEAKKRNVVIILMESVRAKESGIYGAHPSFTPNIDKLAKTGIVFANYYSNASNTTRAEFSILCSYFPHFIGATVYKMFPNLKIVSLPMILKKYGYSTIWISSYSPAYGNKCEFLSKHGVDSFYFTPERKRAEIGWGPCDEDLFDYALKILDEKDEPFFAEIMTLSNHFPFDHKFPTIKDTPRIKSENKIYKGYTRGIFYTDYAIGQFFRKAAGRAWAKNTIFVITGDHGIWTFPNSKLPDIVKEETYFRVPLVVIPPNLKKEETIKTPGSHIDLAPTILELLGIREPNSFLGASLLGQQKGKRLVFMLHENRWNMRLGDLYLYETGEKRFRGHFPYVKKGARLNVSHVGFTVFGDLLSSCKVARIDNRKTRLATFFAQKSLSAYMTVMRADRISPTEDTISETLK
ncbi:MAG: LTA synthase family protein [Elusimicrobia bacterium]|nr:LTA synthase family protein [Elusimicrobiota bacterium]